MNPNLPIHKNKLAEFCKAHHIRRLAIFGSALRADFQTDSDVDVLVEFDPKHIPTLFDIVGMQQELSPMFGNHEVDLGTFNSLKPHVRDEVLKEAQVQYEQR